MTKLSNAPRLEYEEDTTLHERRLRKKQRKSKLIH